MSDNPTDLLPCANCGNPANFARNNEESGLTALCQNSKCRALMYRARCWVDPERERLETDDEIKTALAERWNTRPQAPAPTQRGEVNTDENVWKKHAEIEKAMAHLEGSVQPSRSAVEVAEAIGKAWYIHIMTPGYIEKAASIIQQYGDGVRAAAIEEAAKACDDAVHPENHHPATPAGLMAIAGARRIRALSTVRPNDGLQAMLDKMFESGNQLYYNSADGIAEEWREKQKGTAGWSHQAVMARVYFELMDFVRAYQAALTPATASQGGGGQPRDKWVTISKPYYDNLLERVNAPHPVQATQAGGREDASAEIATELERRCVELDWGNKQSFKDVVTEVLKKHGY